MVDIKGYGIIALVMLRLLHPEGSRCRGCAYPGGATRVSD
jgi:hypothetical protein